MTTPETQATEQPAQLSINDLFVVRQIIDLATSRGAFRGAELTAVGAVFDKLDAFLKQIEAAQEAPAEDDVAVEETGD